jgi:hypothetical protein
MRGTHGVPLLLLLVVGIVLSGGGTGWAQQAVPPTAPPAADPAPWPVLPGEDAPARSILAGVGAVVGSFFYLPFKALGICPGMALASGVSLAVTGGDRAAAGYLLRAGCTGTYFITPGMVQGQEEFQGGGASR